jgi:hypothetical protein
MWTVTYRKMHKKGQTDVVTRKRTRRVAIVKERGPYFIIICSSFLSFALFVHYVIFRILVF